jgi:hypothetical protein
MSVEMRLKRVARARWIGASIILVYWSSLFWLEPLLSVLGLLPLRSNATAKLLTAYFAPPMKLLHWLGRFLPYPEYLFYGPVLAVVAPLVVMLTLWWICVTMYLRQVRTSDTAHFDSEVS